MKTLLATLIFFSAFSAQAAKIVCSAPTLDAAQVLVETGSSPDPLVSVRIGEASVWTRVNCTQVNVLMSGVLTCYLNNQVKLQLREGAGQTTLSIPNGLPEANLAPARNVVVQCLEI